MTRAAIRSRTLEVEAGLPEGMSLTMDWTSMGDRYNFLFDFGDLPKVNRTDRYLAAHYSTMPASVPGLVRCESEEEANHFLDLVSAAESIDYGKVLEFAMAVYQDGWQSAIYAFVDEWCDELPAQADDAPYWWLSEHPEFDGAEMVTTVARSTVYGSHYDIVRPEDDKTSLLIAILPDVGGETSVELAYPLEALGIKEGSLEEFLALQLVCHNGGRYAYVRYDLMGAVWLLAVPENEEFLGKAQESRGFQEYYRGLSEQVEAVRVWIAEMKEAKWDI